MLAAMGERPGKSLPTAFQDWVSTKAAYRLFANENVSEGQILAGQFATADAALWQTHGRLLRNCLARRFRLPRLRRPAWPRACNGAPPPAP